MAVAAGFSMRAYVESMRERTAAELGPLGFAVRDLPPMEVRRFRWWKDELDALKLKASEAEEEVEAAPGKARPPKKRSISDLFAAAPPVDAPGSSGAARLGEDEVLGAMMRRSKEQKRRLRLGEAAAAAATTAAEAEPSAAGEARGDDRPANFARKKAHHQTNVQDKMGTSESSSEELEAPDPNEKKHRKISNLQKIKADKLKYIEGRKSAKVGKQLPPLHSILKKYTKHTSVRMVEKLRNPKRAGVIEVCRKSVKRVKFSEADDVLSCDKQGSKMPEIESLCKIFSDAMTSSSSSTDMSSEGDRHIAAESSSSHMPEKASTMAKKANENTDHENFCKVSSTGSSGLFDLNETLPEHTELNGPYVSNSERPKHEHTQDRTFSMGEQTLDNGSENQKHATDLDIREKGKSPALPHCIVHDAAQLQQSRCPMTPRHDISQLSTGGEFPPCQFQEFNPSHSAKPNFHSEMNVQEERRPAAGQTLRLMGKDLPVSELRNSYLPETSQKHTDYSDKDNRNAKMVLGLPRQGQPCLSLLTPVNPNFSVNTAGMVRDAGGNIKAQFGYRTQHNLSQPLPTANLFSRDLSQYEDRFRNSSNWESRQTVLLGYPPVLNHGTEAFQQSSRRPWHYSDNCTRIVSPSETFVPATMRRVTQSSDYHVNMHQSYGMYYASPSVRSHNYGSFKLTNPAWAVQGVSDSRVSSTLPSRYADTGVARAVHGNSNSSSSSSQLLRSGPVKLSAGAKHILMPSESTVDDNPAPQYSCISFGNSNRDVSVPGEKRVDFRKI